jgi:transposase
MTLPILPPELDALPREDMKSLILALYQQVRVLVTQVQELTAQLQVQTARVAELEAQLSLPPKNSDNSSLPPSKAFKANAKRGKEGKKRKGPRRGSLGRPGQNRRLAENPDKIVRVMAKACGQCGGALSEADQRLHHAYDKIDIPPVKPVITRVEIYHGDCPGCSHKTAPSAVPEGMEPGSPFSPNIAAMAVYLRFIHAISYERLVRLFYDLFGFVISEGGLNAMFQRAKPCFDRQVAAILVRLRKSRVVYSDETSVRIDGINYWNWVFQNDDIVMHVIRRSRGRAVVEDVLGGYRPALWVSDLYGAQQGHAKAWQVCLAHQLRDTRYAIEAGDTIFAPRMKRLLLRAFAISKRRKHLAESTRRAYLSRLNRDLDAIMALPVRHKDGQRLRKRYRKHRGSLFTFLEHPEIAPDNNGSERALRPTATYRKVTGGFRSTWGADLYAAVRSAVGTAAKQGIHAFDAIRTALQPAIA